MTVIIHDLDVNKTELSYEEFIDVLSQKALWNTKVKVEIISEGVERFDSEQEERILSSKWVSWLFNAL
jgi:hypothetical protein